MEQATIVFAAFLLAGITSAEYLCPTEGTTDAWKSLRDMKIGRIYVAKSTDNNRKECSYLHTPYKSYGDNRALLRYGHEQKGRMLSLKATARASGNTMTIRTPDFRNLGDWTVLFTDYQTCSAVRTNNGKALPCT
uniref:Putative lipocalin n=1 Tax=Ornithodoros turicata TaxID=34597 RepID=A0A2R5LAR0_9ACAR